MARDSRLGIVLIFAILTCAGACSRQPPPSLTPEGRAYVKNLQLSDVGMKATDNLARQTLIEIEGTIRNAGNRAVNRVVVTCVFYDFSGKALYQERSTMVSSPLKPGAMRPFRLAFDTIPDGWNNQMPQLVIALVVFA